MSVELPEFPRGNNFPIVVALKYATDSGESAVTDLASADDIVLQFGPDPANPELTINLASGKISIDNPEVGTITATILSTDSLDMSLGTQKMSVQVKYEANNTNNVEWNSVAVFKLKPNNVAPLSN